MRNFFIALLVVATFAFGGCSRARLDTVTQVSTIDALLAGSFDGQMTLGELAKHGDFGIGTYDRLDGEMVVLDGAVYQVCADGVVRSPSRRDTTPFACVVAYRPDTQLALSYPLNEKSLASAIDSSTSDNAFYAVRIDGHFKVMKTRSVPAQTKPYLPLVEVTKKQAVFDYTDVDGTIVGFRCPQFVKGVNVPGYHLHFISADRSKGGHVLSFELDRAASAMIDRCNRFTMILPAGDALGGIDFGVDRSAQLRKAEEAEPKR